MRFITAFSTSPNRLERQIESVATWKQHATEIIAVHTEDDISLLKPHFPQVDFRVLPSNMTGKELYNKPNRVRIKQLCNYGPGLLINSDIEIVANAEEFAKEWAVLPNVFKVGIRQEYIENTNTTELLVGGIDAFLITDTLKDNLPDLGFVLGSSIWDYWIIWHAWNIGMRIMSSHKYLYHKVHDSEWGELETRIGQHIMQNLYGISESNLCFALRVLTNRKFYAPKKAGKEKIMVKPGLVIPSGIPNTLHTKTNTDIAHLTRLTHLTPPTPPRFLKVNKYKLRGRHRPHSK